MSASIPVPERIELIRELFRKTKVKDDDVRNLVEDLCEEIDALWSAANNLSTKLWSASLSEQVTREDLAFLCGCEAGGFFWLFDKLRFALQKAGEARQLLVEMENRTQLYTKEGNKRE